MARMNRLGFNFGPEIGPLSPLDPSPPPPIQTKWVPGTWRHTSNPLNVEDSGVDWVPGHFELDDGKGEGGNGGDGGDTGGDGDGKSGSDDPTAGNFGHVVSAPPRWVDQPRPPSPVIKICQNDTVYQILAAFNQLINKPCFKCFPEIHDCMIRNWESRDITISCYEDDTPPCNQKVDAKTDRKYPEPGFNISICAKIWRKFADPTDSKDYADYLEKTFDYLMDVLTHEMMHVCMKGLGTEVEALAIQYMCNRNTPTLKPNKEEWRDFHLNSNWSFSNDTSSGSVQVVAVLVGNFIALDPKTGRVWALDNSTNPPTIGASCFADPRLKE